MTAHNARHTALIAVLICILGTLTGCFKDEEEDTQYAGQSLVTNAVLGNLKRTIRVSEDSVRTVTVTGSYYPLSIDQIKHRIFNAEPLPYGTHLDKVTFATFNCQGVAAIRRLTAETDTIFDAKDSTDLRQPRLLTIHGYDGESQTTYTLEITAQQTNPDSTLWTRLEPTSGIPADLTNLRLLTRGDSLLLWGETSTDAWLFWTLRSTPSNWHPERLALAPRTQSIVRQGSTFYGLTDTDIAYSTDGILWTRLGSKAGLQQLIGATTHSLYGLTAKNIRRSTNGGQSWDNDLTDTPDSVPTTQIATCCRTTPSNEFIDEILMVGQTAEGQPVVWKRNEMQSPDLQDVASFEWFHLSSTSNRYPLPALQGQTLCYREDSAVLSGFDAQGQFTILVSHDGGYSWRSGQINTPHLAPTTAAVLTTDSDGHLWIVCQGTGEIWKGE